MTQRPPIAVRAATRADAPAVVETLARAFIADDVMAYIFPDEASRPRKLRQFFDLFVRAEPDLGNTRIAGDDAAVTVWRPPGAWRTPKSAMLRLAVPMLRTFGTALPRVLRLQSRLEHHHPAVPHWYLEFAGCDPAHQGQGFGGAAIRAKLADCDAAGLPAALETANPVNLPIYNALGFAVTGTFDVSPALRFWSMWREPVPSR